MKMTNPKGVVAIKVGSFSGLRAFHNRNMEFMRARGLDPGPSFDEMLRPVPDYVNELFEEDK